jgi:hypothetical protein
MNPSRNGKNFIEELRKRRLSKLNNSISIDPAMQLESEGHSRSNISRFEGAQKKNISNKKYLNKSVLNSSREEVN